MDAKQRDAARKRAWRAANPEASRARRKAYVKANPEKVAATNRAQYAANRERRLADQKAWRTANPGALHEWQRANPDRVRGYNASRRASQRDLQVEAVDAASIFTRDAGVCHLCLTDVDPLDWHLDHVIPLAQQGPHCKANVAVAHPACNTSKNAGAWSADPDRWLAALGAYEAFHGLSYAVLS